jgi:hypothetical protein
MGKLAKLSIQAYKTIEFNENEKVGKPFKIMFNPDKYEEKYEIDYKDDQAQGTAGNAPKFSKIKPQDFQFEFLIDGTGVTNDVKKIVSVAKEIEDFFKVVYEYKGEEHRPSFCKIHWGRLLIKCNLKTCSISSTLFNSDGYPLRARIKATFSEVISDKLRARVQADASPDMTHIRQTTNDDNLPLMTYQIYGNIRYYPLVARFNDLLQFQVLEPGTEIVFPPLDELLQLNADEKKRFSNV